MPPPGVAQRRWYQSARFEDDALDLALMAELGPEPQKASEVAERMGRTSPQVAPTRAELIAMGLLYTPEHGYAACTVPHFDQFMRRAVPELLVPEIRRRNRPRIA